MGKSKTAQPAICRPCIVTLATWHHWAWRSPMPFCWRGLAGAAAAMRAAGDAAGGVTDSVSAGVSSALEGLTGAVGGVTEAGAGLVRTHI